MMAMFMKKSYRQSTPGNQLGQTAILTFHYPLTSNFALLQSHVFVIHGVVVDAAVGRRDPCRHLAVLIHAVHQAENVGLIVLARQPARDLRIEFFVRDRSARRIGRYSRPNADAATESCARQRQTERVPRPLDEGLPPPPPTQAFSTSRESWHSSRYATEFPRTSCPGSRREHRSCSSDPRLH